MLAISQPCVSIEMWEMKSHAASLLPLQPPLPPLQGYLIAYDNGGTHGKPCFWVGGGRHKTHKIPNKTFTLSRPTMVSRRFAPCRTVLRTVTACGHCARSAFGLPHAAPFCYAASRPSAGMLLTESRPPGASRPPGPVLL